MKWMGCRGVQTERERDKGENGGKKDQPSREKQSMKKKEGERGRHSLVTNLGL